MKYDFKKLPESAVEIEASLDHQEFLNYWQPEYDKAVSSVQIKGFRPGAAPKNLTDNAVDKEKVFTEAAVKAVKDNLQEIAKENNWQFIDQPKVEILESQVGLKFKANAVIFPDIELGDYKKIAKKIIKENKKEIVVSDNELEKSIEWILNSRAKLVRVSREAKKGDVVNVNFSGFSEGKSLDEVSGKDDQFVLGEGKFIPGFEDNIIGHKENDEFNFSIDFPNDYWNKNLQNKKVEFKVKLLGVFEREIPKLDGDFVKGLGKFYAEGGSASGGENIESFRKSVKDGMLEEKKIKEREKIRLKIIEEITKISKVELPKVMIEHTLENMMLEYKPMLEKLKAEKDQNSETELKKSLEEKARQSVISNLALYKIAKTEHLDPTPEEVKSEADKFLAHSQFSARQANKIDPQKIYDYSYGIVQNKKVFEYLENLK